MGEIDCKKWSERSEKTEIGDLENRIREFCCILQKKIKKIEKNFAKPLAHFAKIIYRPVDTK